MRFNPRVRTITGQHVYFCGDLWFIGSNANRSRRRSLLSWYNNGAANLGKDRCSSTPVPPLPSFGLAEEEAPGPGERYWPTKLRCRVIWPPAASGNLYRARFERSPPSNLMPNERLTDASPHNKMKPYGAPSVQRRGKAGAPLLKGQKPDIAFRSCGRHRSVK